MRHTITLLHQTLTQGHWVLGQFGMGLKDALAVFDRRGIGVVIQSPHATITTGRRPKEGFPDVVTLHALVAPPDDPCRIGTDIALTDVADDDMEVAKGFFLRYSDERPLESTEYGDVFARAGKNRPSRIYVKGLLVAEEPDFLFSYNITKLSAALRRALNRERSNVGRTAYSDRVKAILKACTSSAVAGPLADDLNAFAQGRSHDEIAWRDVALHACQVLQTNEKVVFVSAWQMAGNTAQLQYARDDGYRIVVVPEDIAVALGTLTDLDGNPMVNLNRYRNDWNDSFMFSFVEPADMTAAERVIYQRTNEIGTLANVDLAKHRILVRISETMRLNETGDPVLGVWEPLAHQIVTRRDMLQDLAGYAGTLLHEISHMVSGTMDGTLDFEAALSRLLGVMAAAALR